MEQVKTPPMIEQIDEIQAAESAFLEKKKELDSKADQLRDEYAHLEEDRRNLIMKAVTGFRLTTAEINVMHEVFKQLPGAKQIGKQIYHALHDLESAEQTVTKLIRLGLL